MSSVHAGKEHPGVIFELACVSNQTIPISNLPLWPHLILQRRLQDFVDDPDTTELVYEPMDKNGRYMVVEEASEFSGLIDTEEGDFIDLMHIVIYKAGHAPDDNPTPNVAESHISEYVPSPAKKPKAAKHRTMAPAAADLVAVNQHKRDRRTIEEIQRDNKRSRTGGSR